MTLPEILNETQKMPLEDAREIAERLANYLSEQESEELATDETETPEDEFERQLLGKGVISHIPTRDETDEEFDKFEPIEVMGERLSETIIRERRK